MSHPEFEQAARALSRARRVISVTGAGISAESGIPTFRGPGGMWEGFKAEELATPQAFAADPVRVWRWYRWRREQYHACQPNPGHWALAAIERAKDAFLLATQNVDGLHRRVGHHEDNLVELHGCIERMRCVHCAEIAPLPPGPPPDDPVPVCERCGSMMRPHILWFGEMYWPGIIEKATHFADSADVVIVVGTSAHVWPPIQLALNAKRAGAFMIDINPQATEASARADVHIAAPSGTALPRLLELAGIPMVPS